MRPIPVISRLLLLWIIFAVCLTTAVSQSRRRHRKPVSAEAKEEPPKPGQTRLKLVDNSYVVVDEAWETAQGVWYRQGGLSHLLPKERVKAIQHGSESSPEPETEVVVQAEETPAPPPSQPGVYEKPAWIYLKGGAKVEADSATESASGVWYKRGSMAIFIDRSRIDRIELEDAATRAEAGPKERGWSTGNQKLDALIRHNGTRYGVDPLLIFLVMEQESHFNSRAVSPKGARGLMQLMPGTAARFGVRHPHDAAQNISGGTRYLKQLLNRFNNRVDLVLASYNAGEGAVAKFGNRVPPYRETRNYVKRISFRYKSKKGTKKPTASASASSNGTTSGGLQ
jgi:Zn-finger nucleic acid-binding protein